MRELLGADIQVWMARLDRELENFRVVVRRATYGGEAAAVEQALKLVGSLWWFCRQRAYLVEGREWADALLHAHPQRHSAWYRQAFTGLRQRFLHCWPTLSISCAAWCVREVENPAPVQATPSSPMPLTPMAPCRLVWHYLPR